MSGTVRLASGYRFQWEPAQDCHVLLYPEGMVKLNAPAAAILEHCDGSRDAAGILAALQARFPGVELADDVHRFLEVAHERGWLRTV